MASLNNEVLRQLMYIPTPRLIHQYFIAMKRLTFILFTATIAILMACAGDNSWKQKYGLEGCDNPIFTQPDHEVPGGRVAGAGICMNDGEAYQDYDIGLSREWHYAPKLTFGKPEAATIHRVIGIGRPEEDSHFDSYGRALKFNAKRINGCGALVAYRVGANGPDDLAQYLATYDAAGNLQDVMMMGDEHTVDGLFEFAPHGDYKLVGNWSRLGARLDKDNPGKFVIMLENYYEQAGNRSTWKMNRHYHVNDGGHFVLDSVTSENAPQFNPNALEVLELTLMPLGDEGNYDKAMTALHKLQPILKKSDDGKRTLARMMERLYAYDPEAFLVWVWKCPKCNLTNEVREMVANSHYVGQPFGERYVAQDIHNLTHAKARTYWIKMMRRWAGE